MSARLRGGGCSSGCVGEEVDDLLGQGRAHLLRFFLEDGEAHFDVRRLEVSDQTPFETGNEPVFEVRFHRLARSQVGTDLLVRLVQGAVRRKNSSWMRSLPARNWMSSMSNTSVWR